MTDLWERLVTLVFPHKCFLCERVLEGTGWLCKGCELPTAGGELCVCGKRREECICDRLAGAYVAAAAPLYYTEGVERGIHRFKYDGRSYYAHFLGELMAREVKERFGGVAFDFVTYVPLTRRKERARGYSQTLLLAREVSAALGVPVRGGVLEHTGRGGAQARQKGLEARRQNAGKNFTARPGVDLSGKRVLLVDDVLTTGSTAGRCASLLRERGAEVWVAVAATTRRKPKGKA